jgi:antibiotic biosynthesis monooxygenase (ABM) superfamily enzyme
MFYKVVEGLVPAIASEDYLKETRNKRKRKAKQYEGFETSNIIDRQTVNNSNYHMHICICIFTVQEPITVIDALEGERLD